MRKEVKASTTYTSIFWEADSCAGRRGKETIDTLRKTILLVLSVSALLLSGCSSASSRLPVTPKENKPDLSERVHAFYYGWYATESHDGFTSHWNHDVLGVDKSSSFPGGEDIGANFFPESGTYSSNDPEVLVRHMKQFCDAGVGVLVASWWGPDSFEDRGLAALMDAAAIYDIKVAFHLEPFAGRNAESCRRAIAYLVDRYGTHPAFYRPSGLGGRPLLYVYDSYLVSDQEWRRLLSPEGDLSIRRTDYDAVVIGLWVNEDESDFMTRGHFDGIYTYFASDGFTFGSTSDHWADLRQWCKDTGKIFIPSVGPGYLDTRIRPWNGSTTRARERGAYYDRMFVTAIESAPDFISITSFNEWHEGTQIEPAIPMSVDGFVYEDYSPLPPYFYLTRTRYWVDRFRETHP